MSLTLDNVSKIVAGEVHLSGVQLTLTPGTINVLLGHTGAGKTSLLRVIAGLDRPTQGTIRQAGADVTRTAVGKRSVAFVYQQFINYPSLSVRDNIASPLRRRGARDIEARVQELAKLLQIGGLLSRLPGELSGGQQQRVAIARALAKGADVVLLDEPLVNLDYKLREDLRDELRALFTTGAAGAAAGVAATVVYATTDPAEALALGGTTILMHQGRVLQHAPTLEVYHRPASVVAARVFSDPPMNIVDGVVRDGAIELAGDITIPLGGQRTPSKGPYRSAGAAVGAHLTELAAGEYRFGIRASDCRLNDERAGNVAVRARVELSEISGSETYVYLRGGGDSHFIVQQDGVFHPQLDEELTFYLDPDRLLAFARDGEQPLVSSYHAAPSAPPAAASSDPAGAAGVRITSTGA